MIKIKCYLPRCIVIDIAYFDDALGVRIQIFFSQALSGNGQDKLFALLVVDHFRVSNSNEAVVAVDLERTQVVPSQEGVDDALATSI